MKKFNAKITAILLSMTFVVASVSPAQADFISTQAAVDNAQLELQRGDILATLERQEVRDKLVSMGVDPLEVEDRVAAMTAAELTQINQHIEQMPAGGDALGIVLTLFIVFVITDAVCATDIFPFVNCVNT